MGNSISDKSAAEYERSENVYDVIMPIPNVSFSVVVTLINKYVVILKCFIGVP